MSRPIRHARAQALQGHRAGIASRALAFVVDIAVAFAVYVVVGGGLNLLWDLFFSSELEVPRPDGWISAGAIFWILVLTLGLGWGSTGRTIGAQVMGLRVVRADGSSLRPRQAFLRAFLCALFYPGLLLVLVDRRNRSLQDVLCRTVVVYDWIPEAARPRVLATPRASAGSGASGEEGA